MKCAEFQAQLAGYVLDALEDDERAACAQHLREQACHEGCLEALIYQRRVVLALPQALAPQALAGSLWPRVAARIGGVVVRWPRPAAREKLAYLALAAACVGLLVLGRQREQLLHESARQRDELTSLSARAGEAERGRGACLARLDELERSLALQRDALALAAAPTTRFVALAPLPGKAQGATALIAAGHARVLVLASGVARTAGKELQLWTLRAGTAEPAGFLRVLPGGVAVGEVNRERLASGLPDAFAVSLEPAGGALVPSDVLMVGAVRG